MRVECVLNKILWRSQLYWITPSLQFRQKLNLQSFAVAKSEIVWEGTGRDVWRGHKNGEILTVKRTEVNCKFSPFKKLIWNFLIVSLKCQTYKFKTTSVLGSKEIKNFGFISNVFKEFENNLI